jgi:hypothetical protein
MTENDTAGDALCDFETQLRKLLDRGEVIDARTLPILLAKTLGAAEYSAGIGGDNSLATLGIAEHLRGYGVDLKPIRTAIALALTVELDRKELGAWNHPRARKNALNLFASRVGL